MNHKPTSSEKPTQMFSHRYHRCEFHLAVPPDSRQQSSDAGQLIDVSPPGPIMVRYLSVKKCYKLSLVEVHLHRHIICISVCMYDDLILLQLSYS